MAGGAALDTHQRQGGLSMAGDQHYRVLDRITHGLRWLVWHPWRLVAVVVVVVVVWVVAAQFGGSPQVSDQSTPTAQATGMPSGWADWPQAPAATGTATRPPATASPAPTVATPATASQTASPGPGEAVWDTASRQAALDTGVAAVAAYIGGDQAALDAMLGWDVAITARVRADVIATADPAKPGAPLPHVTSEASPLSTTVIVPTSGGDFRVGIARWSGADPWLVQTIDEPR
jgi:cytoskeletal protein RodZ